MVEEQSEVATLDSLVDICVCEHDVRTFAAELEAHTLEIRSASRFEDRMTHFRRTGKRHFVDIHVVRDGSSCRWSVARQNIHHTRRETGLKDEFSHSECSQRASAPRA